ncbi:hypothetical protein ES703_04883 [subsurface metagenome]
MSTASIFTPFIAGRVPRNSSMISSDDLSLSAFGMSWPMTIPSCDPCAPNDIPPPSPDEPTDAITVCIAGSLIRISSTLCTAWSVSCRDEPAGKPTFSMIIPWSIFGMNSAPTNGMRQSATTNAKLTPPRTLPRCRSVLASSRA